MDIEVQIPKISFEAQNSTFEGCLEVKITFDFFFGSSCSYSGDFFIEVRDSPHGIFGSWARWNRAQPRFQSSWETAVVVAAAAAVVVSWKFRSTFRPGNY